MVTFFQLKQIIQSNFNNGNQTESDKACVKINAVIACPLYAYTFIYFLGTILMQFITVNYNPY